MPWGWSTCWLKDWGLNYRSSSMLLKDCYCKIAFSKILIVYGPDHVVDERRNDTKFVPHCLPHRYRYIQSTLATKKLQLSSHMLHRVEKSLMTVIVTYKWSFWVMRRGHASSFVSMHSYFFTLFDYMPNCWMQTTRSREGASIHDKVCTPSITHHPVSTRMWSCPSCSSTCSW
jgi:hypothetical protein